MVNMQDSDSWAPSSILGGTLVFYGYQSYFTQTPTQKIHSTNMQKYNNSDIMHRTNEISLHFLWTWSEFNDVWFHENYRVYILGEETGAHLINS